MHKGARRSADPAVVKAAAPAKPAARAASPPTERIGNAAFADPPGATARGDALGGILARAVEQRGGDTAIGHKGATLQRAPPAVATKASHFDEQISVGQSLKANVGLAKTTRLFAAIRDGFIDYQRTTPDSKERDAQRQVLKNLCDRYTRQDMDWHGQSHHRKARRAIVQRLRWELQDESDQLARARHERRLGYANLS